MKYLRKIFESDNSSIWDEIEDILTPIRDNGVISFKVQNFKFLGRYGSRSSILIKKEWGTYARDESFYNIEDIKDELNHLCSRFPEVVNQIQIFRSRAQNPTRYTPQEFIKESPTGTTFLVGVTFKIKKEGAPYIPQ